MYSSIALIILTVSLYIFSAYIYKKYSECSRELNVTKVELETMKVALYRESRINHLTLREVVNVNNDVKYAIQYAMKAAHPDNGGKEEDFVKFRKMYESLRG